MLWDQLAHLDRPQANRAMGRLPLIPHASNEPSDAVLASASHVPRETELAMSDVA